MPDDALKKPGSRFQFFSWTGNAGNSSACSFLNFLSCFNECLETLEISLFLHGGNHSGIDSNQFT
jgi:hypothetical protein